MANLAGPVAVVTGGASGIGIGFGMARAFLAEGARVVLADVDPAAMEVAEMTLSGLGGEALGVVTDESDPESVRQLAQATLERLGGIDIICNNAGVWTLGYQWDTSEEDWRWVLDVNLWGVIHGIRVFVPLLLANPAGGHVVNTASIGGLVAGGGTGPYAATKHAVIGLSKSLRAELAVQKAHAGVTIVCPGRVATPILRWLNTRPNAGRPPTLPDELEAVAAAMCSADGGMSPPDTRRLIVDAVKTNATWVFPGAYQHRPLVEREIADLLAVLPANPTSRKARW